MGGPAHTGLRSRWLWPRPRVKNSLPEHHLCPCLGLLGLYRFFFTRIDNFESLHCFPKWWITFRFRLPFIVNVFGHVSSALHGDFRIMPPFTFSHLPLATFPHIDFWDPATRHVGWVRQEGVYCYRWYVFSFLFLFFLLTSPKSPHSTLLANGHGHPLPRGPTRPTTDHNVLYPHPHVLCRRALARYTNHVTILLSFVTPCAMSALPLAAARTMLPCPLRLHAPRHHACAGLPSTRTFSFFFFLLTPSCAVQSPCSHCYLCRWMGGVADAIRDIKYYKF